MNENPPIPSLPTAAAGPVPQTLPTGPAPLPTPPPIAPAPLLDSSDKTLAVICHLSVFFGMWFVVPLIVYFIKRHESPFVAAHAREVLNFHLSLITYCICTIPLVFLLIGIPILIVLGIAAFVCALIGAFRASEGAIYHYPLTIRFLG